jgi:hypothetical protein
VTVLDYALAYAAAGVPVFPCRPRPETVGDKVLDAKSPRTRNGFHDASCDPDLIGRWWQRCPDSMIGVPTEGFVVVDVDVAPDDRQAAWRAWLDLATPHGWEVDDTVMAATPRDGLHIWWCCPDGAEVRNSASKIAPHIDIRASGGYAVVPPSVSDSGPYEWLNSNTPTATAPSWLIEACTATPGRTISPGGPSREIAGSRYGATALESELGRLAIAPMGARNDTLVRAAYRVGQLAAGGCLDQYCAADQLHAVALRIGLSEHEATSTIRSGIAAGAQHPRRPAA